MATSNEPAHHPTTCPLARDADGNTIDLPAGSVGWRVRRQTGGRPRIVLGVDKQPMQLPLGYTIVDLEDILAPGAYRLDVVDQRGEPLGLTIAVSIGQLRNADAEPDEDQPAAASPMLPTSGSETRLVLEANVRATQMAFQHNQKTLELGLRMAETLRDGVRVMAESQADWIKSLASARGFFRNAPPLPAPPPPEPAPESTEEEDAEDEPAPEPHWVERLVPHVEKAAAILVPVLVSRFSGPSRPSSKWEIADALDWRRAERKHNATKEAEPAAGPTPTSLAELDPADMQHFLQIQAALTPDEAALARAVAKELSPSELQGWFAELRALSVPDAVAKIRQLISGSAKPAA